MTADLVARAVIASARVYGDDPAGAVEGSPQSWARRCLPAAASAVARALRVDLQKPCRALGLNYQSVRAARVAKRSVFSEAEAAASRAVSYAAWRPEARASVIERATRRLPPEPRPELSERPVRVLNADEEASAKAADRARLAQAVAKPTPWEAAELTLSDRILETLAQAPGSPSGLATRLDAKEAAVTACMAELARVGAIIAEAMPEAGRRYQKWARA